MATSDSNALELGCWVSPDPSGEEGAWIASIEVDAPAALVGEQRPPLDLMLVVDRSSSMVGARIASAVEAARQICLRLNERDRIGVVAFDASVATVLSPGAATAETASEVFVALTELGVGYGTNISGGWKRAAELIHRGGIPGVSKTVLLLTDGLPSRGLMRSSELTKLVRDGAEQGIVTNTLGIGDRFDEKLLARMAMAGGGAFRFAERDEDTIVVADEEVEGLKGLVAESSVLHIGFSRAVERYEVIHEMTCRNEGDGLAIELGRLFAGRARNVIIQLVVDRSTRHLGAVGLSCVGATGDWSEAGPERILLPAPGQEAEDQRRVGAAYVPLRIARWQQQIWDCGRDASPLRLREVLHSAQAEISGLSAELMDSDEAKESVKRFNDACVRIAKLLESDEGDVVERRRQTAVELKTMTEESTKTVTGLTQLGPVLPTSRRRRGWGKRER
jgi:hypothetical protein